MADQEIKILLTGDASSAMGVIDSLLGKLGGLGVGFGSVAEIGAKITEKAMEGLKELASFIPESIEQVDALAKTFEGLEFQTGENLEQLSIYASAMRLVGGTMEDLTGWLKGVTMSMRSHTQVFIENGIAADENALMQMKPIEVMKASLDVIEHCTDSNKRLILEQEMLGRAGVAQIPLMKRFFDSLGEGEESMRQYGGAMTQAMIDTKNANEKIAGDAANSIQNLKNQMQQQWSDWSQIWDQVKIGFYSLVSGLMGAVAIVGQTYHNIFDPLTGFIQGVIDKTVEAITEIKNFLGWAAKEEGTTSGDSVLEKKEALAARAYKHSSTDQGGGDGSETLEQIKAREAGQKAFEAELRKDKREALLAENKEIEIYNQILEKGRDIEVETLKIKSEGLKNIADKRLADIALVQAEHDKAKQGIEETRDKAPSPENIALANDAISALDARLTASITRINEKYGDSAYELGQKIAAELAHADGGLSERYQITESHYHKLMEEQEKLKGAQSPEVYASNLLAIEGAEKLQKAKDLAEQTKLDLEELKKQVKEYNENNGPMTQQETANFSSNYASTGKGSPNTPKGGPAKDQAMGNAQHQFNVEMHFDKTAADGALTGLKTFVAQSDNAFATMQKFAMDMANSLTSNLTKAFTDILTKGLSFGNAMKDLFKSMSQAIIQALVGIAARQAVNWGISQVIANWKTAAAVKEKIQTTTQAAAEKTATASQAAGQAAVTSATITQTTALTAQTTALAAQVIAATAAMSSMATYAASEIWAAYAYIPFGGAALAAAEILEMEASLDAVKSITALAVGSRVTSPTMAMIGESGPEIVAPESSFADWARANQNLGSNLASHQAQVSGLQAAAGSYGSQALASNGGSIPSSGNGVQIGVLVAADTLSGQRVIDQMVNSSNQRIGRYNG